MFLRCLPKTFPERAAFLTACLIPVLAFFFILWLKPFWGPMDDSNFVLGYVEKTLREGVLRASVQFGLQDFGWGMFRPLYPAMAVFVYWPGMHSAPWVSFLWNAFWVFCLLGAYCTFLARALGLSASLVLLACASFFYGWDLFQHLSLQEKLVLTTGLLTVWVAWNRNRFSTPKFWILFPFVFLLGACSKASFAIHYSVAVMAFLASQAPQLKVGNRKAWLEAGAVCLMEILLVLFYAKISANGSYTKHYSYGVALPNLFSFQGGMLAIPLLLAFIALGLRWREVWKNPVILLPATGVAAFLAVFLPWGIMAYVQSVMAPLFAAMLVQLAHWWLPRLPKAVWVVPLCVLALSVTIYRGATMFGRLNDLGRITALGPELYQLGVREIWMPCDEGAGSMHYFFKSLPGPTPDVHFLNKEMGKGEIFLIYDRALCPLPGRAEAPSGCETKLLWQGSWPKSYRLVKATCS